MSSTAQFFIGVSPILVIMIGTLCAGGYTVFRRMKHHND